MELFYKERLPRAAFYRRLMADVQPMARCAERMEVHPADPVSIVSCLVLAPAMVSFVQWVLLEALKSGRQRLYFLARDGYLMYRTARYFCKQFQLPLELRYVSCSRYALRLPLFHSDLPGALDTICRGALRVDLNTILRRAGLTEQERQEVLFRLPLPFRPGEPLSGEQRRQVRAALEKCTVFLSCMERHSKTAQPLLAGYLEQCGFLDDVPDAVVDSGWLGSQQQAIGVVLKRLGRRGLLEGYYWGLYDLPPAANPSAYHAYAFTPWDGLWDKVYLNNCLFEAVFTAPHGMTVGYEQSGSAYKPLYDKANRETAGLTKRLEADLLRYSALYAEAARDFAWAPNAIAQERRVIRLLLRAWMCFPTKAEAEAFGCLPFSDDVLGDGETILAPCLPQTTLRRHHLLPRIYDRIRQHPVPFQESAWFAGSAVRSTEHPSYHLQQNLMYQAFRWQQKQRQCRASRRKGGS